jgi:hypothetical protein
MPFSWVKVSVGTSHKIRRCTDGNPSRRRFEECVRAIIEAEGGRVDSVLFELNGKFAHVHLYYENDQQRANIFFDIEAEDVVDLVTAAEIDHRREHRTAD